MPQSGRGLEIARGVDLRASAGDRKRRAAELAEHPVHLPAAGNRTQHTALGPLLAWPPRQIVDEGSPEVVPSIVSAVVIAARAPVEEPVIFNEVPNPTSPCRFSTLRPGPFARESIPLEGVGRPATAAQQRAINEIGNKYGCHTCGSPSPGTQSGNWVLDHQPATAMTLPGQSQFGYPHCARCFRMQGGEVRAWQQ